MKLVIYMRWVSFGVVQICHAPHYRMPTAIDVDVVEEDHKYGHHSAGRASLFHGPLLCTSLSLSLSLNVEGLMSLGGLIAKQHHTPPMLNLFAMLVSLGGRLTLHKLVAVHNDTNGNKAYV